MAVEDEILEELESLERTIANKEKEIEEKIRRKITAFLIFVSLHLFISTV